MMTDDINKALYDLANKIGRRKGEQSKTKGIVQVDKMDLVIERLDKLIATSKDLVEINREHLGVLRELLTPDTRSLIKHSDKETGETTWIGWLYEDGTITTEWEKE